MKLVLLAVQFQISLNFNLLKNATVARVIYELLYLVRSRFDFCERFLYVCTLLYLLCCHVIVLSRYVLEANYQNLVQTREVTG